MELVNVRVKYIRPEYQNLKDWCDDPNNEYIGRAGVVFINGQRYPKKSSVFANPFTVRKYGRYEAIEKYREYIINKIENENMMDELLSLQNKRLGCWCAPDPCHGDVLIELIDKYKN